MSDSAYFQVDPQLARLLGETYRSSEQALKELIDNAWDADAIRVDVSLPKPMTQDAIIVRDNGMGMNEAQIRSEYLKIARDKRAGGKQVSSKFKRRLKGRKGIGKFAGLTVASKMLLTSWHETSTCRLELDKKILTEHKGDLERVPLNFEVIAEASEKTGTQITLTDLDQSLNFPRPHELKRLLFREYGRNPEFQIFVDGDSVGFRDLPGHYEDATGIAGPEGAKLRFTITDEKSKMKDPGISLRVDGKIVGRPSYFGLDDDPEIPPKLLKQVAGEVEIEEVAGLVTADWGDLNQSSKVLEQVASFVREKVKVALSQTHSKQISAQKARLQRKIKQRLEKLPENRRASAQQAIEKILGRFYGESDDKIAVIIDVALDAMELDGYWAVLDQINKASNGEVQDFADALDSFGLLELANIGSQARNRDMFLTHLHSLARDQKTTEAAMHTALERNLWVFGMDKTLIATNQTFRRIVSDYLGSKYKGKRADKRPDLFLGGSISGQYLLIEFKRPDKVIGRKEISQAEDYRDGLRPLLPSDARIDVIIIGKKRNPEVASLAEGVVVESYESRIASSRSEIDWILKQLTS
ncbi:ATP-binding protein [Pseudoprimorskyibacter insulae]|uniref:DNA mismatch repair protein MutL n=1 Tax=Pseudoprimorskyibacter insulae TaxID=1695997 RepID=A0A2R8AZS4_9RHOB|nr:ATP-binding protein [Pseudoprimorskyibacter insulae]SPF81349.1 DNA mismatch repair protein MutL [Pseudoprimorskyibacter insulae]